jgi:small ligand-binding sensory domain FIST
MQWASAISSEPNANAAATELKRDISRQLGRNSADLVLAFLTPHYEEAYDRIPALIADHLSPKAFIGCTAAGVIGNGREIEQRPGFALVAAVLPEVEIHPFHLEAGDLPDQDVGPERWVQSLGVQPEPTPHFIMLVDAGGAPGFDPRPLVRGLDYAYSPRAAKIGGLASVLQGNCLFLGEEVHHSGCVGVALQGNIVVDTVVAQGCRPVGGLLTVTGCSGYYLTGLDDRPAVEVLVELYHSLPADDQQLLQSALHLGIAATEFKQELGLGDFLIRDVMQLDHEKGFIAVGDLLRPGQTVQFHVRDAAAATQDLELMLRRYCQSPTPTLPAGGLLFTCTGRGQHLFQEPDHDSVRFADAVGDIPLGGFFCGGEIGQVGDSTYIHGYTSSFGIFRPAH